ncbi:hypothetical protein [uncultured Porphyromonas sp.]|uniref:hypothetical protein n=1 Tax=uncultured Porphyromonas sp. TaxID=159274 RepID=UPI00261827C3|nr:hypothetical protein [uncultured Porphyromonas sp.]
MGKQLRIWLFVLLGTLLTSTSLLAEGIITMTTSKAIGEKILLGILAKGDIAIDGALETGEMNEDGFKFYTIKSQTITIRGDVTELDCNENQLTSLDLSQNTALTKLDCSWNLLTSLDVSKSAALEILYCNDNKLTNLDVSKNTALDLLFCSNNKLTNLNMSGCARLRVIACDSNYIKGKAMTKLVNCLPNRRGMYCGTIFLVDSSSKKSDKNRCSAADVATAKRKNWKVLK